MKKQISENLIWKIGSLLIAVIVWITVMNIIRPLVEERVNVPIEILSKTNEQNISNIYNIRDNINNVNVSFRVRSDYAGKINSSDMKAIIEVPDDYTDGFLPIKINYLNNVKNYIASSRYFPTTLYIEKDEMVKEIFEIATHTGGQLAPGLRVGNITLSQNIVEITGNRTDVENVKEVRVDIPLGEQSKNFSGQAAIKICDAYGNEITNSTVRANIENVDYTVILYSVKTVNIEAKTIGSPLRGYILDSINIEPARLSLGGTKELVAGIYSIVLPEIDITNISTSMDYEFEIKEILPNGIIDVSNTERIKVSINIKQDGTHIEPEAERVGVATTSSSKIISPSINKETE